jgi:hypothetical protein
MASAGRKNAGDCGTNAGHHAGNAPNQACSTGTAPAYPDAGVNSGGATVGLMYGSNQTCVALKARNVRYPKNNTKPSAVVAGPIHQWSMRSELAKPLWRAMRTSTRGTIAARVCMRPTQMPNQSHERC